MAGANSPNLPGRRGQCAYFTKTPIGILQIGINILSHIVGGQVVDAVHGLAFSRPQPTR